MLLRTLERIEEELNNVRQERRRAEQDSTSQLSILEGWEGALVWVKRIIKEEGAMNVACEQDDEKCPSLYGASCQCLEAAPAGSELPSG